jgi:urease accessory protein
MLRLAGVIGHRDDPAIAGHLHELGHRDRIEYLILPPGESERRRLRWATDKGTDCAISLERDERLTDGVVLLLEPERAILVHVGEQRQWRLRPQDLEAALLLGWHAGHLHWRVRFEGRDLVVLLEGPEADYRDRIATLIEAGAVAIVEGDGRA